MSVALIDAMRQTIISAIADPNVAFVMIAVGILGIYAEFCSPGRVAPGVLGGVFVLLGLSSIAIRPINWVGVALLASAVGLLLLEVKSTSHGVAGIAGALAMTAGALKLVAGPTPELRIRWITAVGVSLPLSVITIFLLKIAARARRNKGPLITACVACETPETTAMIELRPFTKTSRNRSRNG